MSINNGKAVIEAIFNKKSPFVRTPKYGIDRKKVTWQNLRYTALKSVAPVFEILFAVYFTVLIGISIAKGYCALHSVLAAISGGILLRGLGIDFAIPSY